MSTGVGIRTHALYARVVPNIINYNLFHPSISTEHYVAHGMISIQHSKNSPFVSKQFNTAFMHVSTVVIKYQNLPMRSICGVLTQPTLTSPRSTILCD